MGLSAVIYDGIQISFKFDSSLLRLPLPLPSFQASKFSRVQFPLLYTVNCRCRRVHYAPIACSIGTEQEEVLYIQLSVETSCTLSSVGTLGEEDQGPESYTSSVTTVAFWVCAAVAFGVGLGLKDGVGRESEFFAGIGCSHMV